MEQTSYPINYIPKVTVENRNQNSRLSRLSRNSPYYMGEDEEEKKTEDKNETKFISDFNDSIHFKERAKKHKD